MTRQRIYGSSVPMTRPNLDVAVVTNEDFGFNASLVTATNDTFETTIPYPQEWDPENEVCTFYELRFMQNDSNNAQDDSNTSLLVTLSMIDRSATATYRGVGVDADDEWRKSLFRNAMFFGTGFGYPTATTGANLVQYQHDTMIEAVYRPKLPIPAFFPVYPEVVNVTTTYATATGDETAATYSVFERMEMSYDYTIRKMNRRERAMFQGLPGFQQRLSQLAS